VERVIRGVLTGRRRDIILTLHREGPLTLSKLRNALKISSSTLLYELSALESLGVVKREDVVVYLTELGERVASIISTIEPLKSLNFLSLLGLRPLVVWFLFSPYAPVAAAAFLLSWIAALSFGALQDPPLTLLGIAYVGYYLPLSVKLEMQHALVISILSVALIFVAGYLASKRRLRPLSIVVGVLPLAIYPTVHMTLVQVAHATGVAYVISFSQILLFVSLLFTATVFATVYSLESGAPYESSLAYSLLLFFVAPALVYLFPR